MGVKKSWLKSIHSAAYGGKLFKESAANLFEGSRGGDQGVDGPDGKQGDGGESEQPAQRGGPDWSDQPFPQAKWRPAHQGEHKGSLLETERGRTGLVRLRK